MPGRPTVLPERPQLTGFLLGRPGNIAGDPEVRDRRVLRRSVVIPVTGWAADRFGAKRTYMAAIALFTARSALP